MFFHTRRSTLHGSLLACRWRMVLSKVGTSHASSTRTPCMVWVPVGSSSSTTAARCEGDDCNGKQDELGYTQPPTFIHRRMEVRG